MKESLEFIAIIASTFTLAFLTSALLSVDWVMVHWVRQLLVIVLMFIELGLGLLMAYHYIKSNIKPKNQEK
jgi:hypothetical protein